MVLLSFFKSPVCLFFYSISSSPLKYPSMTSLAGDSAVVLHHHTTATNHFTGSSLSVSFTETYTFPYFLVVALVRSIWCSAQRSSSSLTGMGSSQLNASKDGLGACLRLWPPLEFHMLNHCGWGRSSAPLVEQYSVYPQQQCLPGHGSGLQVELNLDCAWGSTSLQLGGSRERAGPFLTYWAGAGLSTKSRNSGSSGLGYFLYLFIR